MRNTKTEYVSCPSCGRTLFDLQEVTEQIRTRTGHLPGVSIAIMGCIVNGPGEMADADFGCALPSGDGRHLSARPAEAFRSCMLACCVSCGWPAEACSGVLLAASG